MSRRSSAARDPNLVPDFHGTVFSDPGLCSTGRLTGASVVGRTSRQSLPDAHRLCGEGDSDVQLRRGEPTDGESVVADVGGKLTDVLLPTDSAYTLGKSLKGSWSFDESLCDLPLEISIT